MNTNKLRTRLAFIKVQSLILLLLLSFSTQSFSQNTDLDKILASDGVANQNYGGALRISEDYLVVGTTINNINSSVYVYSKDNNGNWANEQKLSSPFDDTSYYFGISVSIAGNTIVIGAPNYDNQLTNTGAAYVYEVDSNGQWNFKQTLLVPNINENDHFGHIVYNTADYIIVNGRELIANTDNEISVYIFEKNQNGDWYNTQKIDLSQFGIGNSENYISMYGDYLVIGDHHYSEIGLFNGAVHIYKKNVSGTWEYDTTIVASDGEEGDYFGTSVSIYENTLVVGASYSDAFGEFSGAAYVYELDGNGNWGNEQKLLPSEGVGPEVFGYDVEIHGDRLIVGAAFQSNFAPSAGAAYTFQRSENSEWIMEDIYAPLDLNGFDAFGWAVSIVAGEIAIGANHHDGNGIEDSGAVYVTSINCSFSLECPENMVIETNMDACEGLATFDDATLIPEIIDGCGGINISQISGPASGEILEAGSYEISFEAISAEGISDNCTFSIEVVDNEAPTALCQDLEFVLNPCNEISIQAEDVDLGSSDACGIASYNLSQTIFDENSIGSNPVELTVTDIHGNSASCDANIQINPSIEINESALIEAENITLNYGETLDLVPNIGPLNAWVFSWYINGDVFCEDCYSISLSPETNGSVELVIQDSEGCKSYSDALSIQVLVEYSVHIPNIFSPNNDGINDVFQAFFSDGVKPAYELQIRDRWGNIVYYKKGEQIAWNGQFRGEDVAEGVYTYALVFSLVNGVEIVETGDVYLMR
jgi:gliding motility-associated-like protein